MEYTIVNRKKLSQMSLGTVQLGMNYGIANEGGQPDLNKSHKMLETALTNGVTSLDTARGYGESEDVLGKFLKKIEDKPFITSKFMLNLPEETDACQVEKAIIESVETSLAKLNVKKLDCLLMHRGIEMTKHGDIVPKTLEKLIKENYTDMVGVSVYQPEELDVMFQNDLYQATQIPMGLFNQEFFYRGYTQKLKERGIVTFVRSVFCQGLFFLEPKTMTDPLLIEYAVPYLEKLRALSEKASMSIAEFAISYIRDIPGVTSLVLGADTPEQVLTNIGYMHAPALSDEIRKEAEETFRAVKITKIMEVLTRPKN